MREKMYNLKSSNETLENKSIIYLDNKYFYVYTFDIESINEDDRYDLIIEELYQNVENFSEDDYCIQFEILNKSKISEEVQVYIIKNEDIVANTDVKELKNGKIISIIPTFLICRNIKDISEYINIDFSLEKIFISFYKDNKLVVINTQEIESVDDVCTFIENTYNDKLIILTGNETFKTEVYKRLYNKLNIKNYMPDKISYMRNLNFIPDQYKNLLHNFLNNKIFILFILVLIILTIFARFILIYMQEQKNDELYSIEYKNTALAKEIKENRELLTERKKNITNVNKYIKNKVKLSFILDELNMYMGKNTYIEKIYWNEENVGFAIDGVFFDIKDLINLIDNLNQSKVFKVRTYKDIHLNKTDSIKKYKFKIILDMKEVDSNEI